MSVTVDFYAVLDVGPDASEAAVKKAFKVAALRWHPDKNPGKEAEAAEKFKKIAEAYAVLGDKDQRSRYDSTRKAHKVEVEVVIISDDEDKQPAPAGKPQKKRRKPSYFSPSFTFEQAKRFFDDFLEQEDSWDPQPEEPFHGNPQEAELSPPVFAHSSDDNSDADDSDSGQPKRARLNPIFKARMNATLGVSNLGRPKSKPKNRAEAK